MVWTSHLVVHPKKVQAFPCRDVWVRRLAASFLFLESDQPEEQLPFLRNSGVQA